MDDIVLKLKLKTPQAGIVTFPFICTSPIMILHFCIVI